MLDRLEFLISEAAVSLRRNTWMTFAAVTTAAMALFLLGGLAYVYASLAGFVHTLGDRVEMKVFVRDSVPDDRAKAMGDRLLKLPGVSTVRYVPRDVGLKEFLAQNPNIDIKGLEVDNPLPNAYVVTVKELKDFTSVAQAVQTMPEVEPGGVKYPATEQDFLASAMKTIPWLGFTLGGLMLLTSGILIYNAIRLTVMARQREIRIMQLVGATRSMVWAPLLIEGLVQGSLGGLLAALVLWSTHSLVQATLIRSLSAFGQLAPFPIREALFVLALAGAAYGLVCSSVAVTEPLRLRRRAI